MNHSFNVELAIKYGIEEAILIENFAFWIKKNAANNKNYINGEYWTYNSAKALEELFPYMNLKKIQRTLIKLEELKIFKSGNFNKKTYDRTKWYCIIDSDIKAMYQLNYNIQDDKKALDKMSNEKNQGFSEEGDKNPWTKCPMDLDKMSNGYTQNVQPIPDINSDINQIKTTATNIDTVNKKESTVSKQQRNSSSSLYEFLNKYELDAGTKENIKKHIPKLTEERFETVYTGIKKRFQEGKIKNFSAVLFTALKDNWEIITNDTPAVDVEKEKKQVKGTAAYYLDYYKCCGGSVDTILKKFVNDLQHIKNKDLVEEYKNKLFSAMRKEE